MEPGDCEGDSCDQANPGNLCVAMRGNGELISAHFASLARIVEHYGLIAGASGGSSASISLFVTESIQLNPHIRDCNGTPCSAEETAARAGFLLKSFPGYLQALATTDEATAFLTLQPIAQRVQQGDLATLAQTDPIAARDALITIFSSQDIRDLINPEIVSLLQNSPNLPFHVRDIVDGVMSFGKFDATNNRILIRPGLLDFSSLADKLGRAASFYAGYDPVDGAGMQTLLASCAMPGRGKAWPEVAALPAGGATCGALLGQLITSFRDRFVAGGFHTRADDMVGQTLPVLISTSVLTGPAADAWRAARAQYKSGAEYTLDVNFDDVKFGYWGKQSELDRVGGNPNKFTDAKTGKFLSLGEATWREVLALSPAEPGLARGLEIDGMLISAGGWSDLHPVLALENLGCDKIVYVTRTGDESGFAQGVATMLGMTPAQKDALYNLDNPASSYAQSIATADGTWCTNWNDFKGTQLVEVANDSYNAPLETRDDFFVKGPRPYPGAKANLGKRGCTPAGE